MAEEETKEAEKKEAPVGEEAEKKEEKKSETIEIRQVMVIDDSSALRRVLVKYVENKFYCEILEADNGKDALKKIAEKGGKIDLVLCDLMMPVMDGLTFLKTFKGTESLKEIPVMCLTAKNDRDTVTKCIKLGAIDFIVKPYDLVSISKKIGKYLQPKS